MTRAEAIARLTRVFHRLRREQRFELGIGELVAAVRAVELGWGATDEDLLKLARLLWAHSPGEQQRLDLVWTDALQPEAARPAAAPGGAKSTPKPPPARPPVTAPQKAGKASPEFTPQPVKAPPLPPAQPTEAPRAYWPVSRRAMAYSWRKLKRMAADGPADVLDVDATVARAARDGFFLEPVYRRRERNRARLVLLVDQEGSMAPFHPFCRDLVETARLDGALEEVAVYYFHNVPGGLYEDAVMTRYAGEIGTLAAIDSSVLVVSDAGAARGYHRGERVRETSRLLAECRRRTHLVAWLNPMPQSRWRDNSALAISQLIPMRQLDEEGFGQAVQILRGARE